MGGGRSARQTIDWILTGHRVGARTSWRASDLVPRSIKIQFPVRSAGGGRTSAKRGLDVPRPDASKWPCKAAAVTRRAVAKRRTRSVDGIGGRHGRLAIGSETTRERALPANSAYRIFPVRDSVRLADSRSLIDFPRRISACVSGSSASPSNKGSSSRSRLRL